MKPGNHAFAAATVDIPARRSSFTIRSCNVPKARSIRPFACGLLAQMMSMFRSISARPNCVRRSPATASLAFTRKNAVFITVKGNWLAMDFQISTGRSEVIERRLRGHEPQLHQTTRCIVDECQQCAGLAARLEPGMFRAIDLHQLT